jgi:DNA repair protein RadD
MYTLRPYQIEAINTLLQKLKEKQFVLLECPTGSGKTVIYAELIKLYMKSFPRMYIGVIEPRVELINQTKEKILAAWPEGFMHIGTACATVGPVMLEKSVTVGSVQTLVRREMKNNFDLIIMDEVHHFAPLTKRNDFIELIEGMEYHDILRIFYKRNKKLRILGVTATPFRLNHGYIYGTNCRPDYHNLFPELDYSITLNQLIEAKYLSPWKAFQPVRINKELADIKLSHYGDYQIKDLSKEMSKEIHIHTAVDVYEKYGQNRKNVLIFAVTIEHANLLADAFREKGYNAASVHSKMPMTERRQILNDFYDNKINFLVNVGILTEGWDSPKVDLIIMCRPTMSPGLFVQMIGRGTRIHEGKENLLILDLAENFIKHGDPSYPTVVYNKKDRIQGSPPMKRCPECYAVVHLATKICPECEFLFLNDSIIENVASEAPEMINYADNDDIKPKQTELLGAYIEEYTSKANNEMLKLTLYCKDYKSVYYYINFSHPKRFVINKSKFIWNFFAGYDKVPPASNEEALERKEEIIETKVTHVTVFKEGNFYRIEEIPW